MAKVNGCKPLTIIERAPFLMQQRFLKLRVKLFILIFKISIVELFLKNFTDTSTSGVVF